MKNFASHKRFSLTSCSPLSSLFSLAIYRSRHSRMEQVKFVEDSLEDKFEVMCFFKGCLPQTLLGPFLNTLTHMTEILHMPF